MQKSVLKSVFALFIALLLIPAAFAQTAAPIIPEQPDTIYVDGKPEPINPETLIIPHAQGDVNAGTYFQSVYLPEITRVVISIAGAMAFLFIIIGGIQILTAYGDEEKITTAKKTITYAIIGLLVALLSYAIVSIISGVQIGKVTQQPMAPGSEDMSTETMNDPGKYGSGGSREALSPEDI